MSGPNPSCSCGRYAAPALTRREALRLFAGGFGALALHSLVAGPALAGRPMLDLRPKAPRLPARARPAILLYIGSRPPRKDLPDPDRHPQHHDRPPHPGAGGHPSLPPTAPASVREADRRLVLDPPQPLWCRDLEARSGLGELGARVQNFPLAAGMQIEALKPIGWGNQPSAKRKRYRLDEEG